MEDFLNYQIKADAARAYKVIFDQYYKPLCSFARKYVLDLDIAEDIIQDLFLKFWEQRNDIEFNTSIKSYLFQSARNECLNYLKHQFVEEKYKEHILNTSSEAFFQDKLEEEEINQMLYKAIQSLTPRCKQIFELSRFEGKSFDEIALELSISKNTIKNQMVTTLKQIRLILERNEMLFLVAYYSGLLSFIIRCTLSFD